ncbi:MAG: hypothetical protein ACLP5V_08595 [Candidatus Bathyarchaeia archaeon]
MRKRRGNQRVEKIPSPYFENYDYHWGFASFHNKTVLDIGADYGSTASYFLQNGARRVIAVESNPKLFSKLVAYFRGNQLVTTINLEVHEPHQIESLISKFKPDILKADCEGCELHLIKVEERALKTVPEFLIETHEHTLKRLITPRIERLFRRLGYSYATYEVIPSLKGKLKTKVVHAKRKWSTLTIREDKIAGLKTSLALKTQEESLKIEEVHSLERKLHILENASGPLAILLVLYSQRTDLRSAFPEVRDGDYSNLLLWARYVVERRTDAYHLLQPYASWIRINPITDLADLTAQLAATKAELAAIRGSVGFRFIRFYASTIDRLFQRRT